MTLTGNIGRHRIVLCLIVILFFPRILQCEDDVKAELPVAPQLRGESLLPEIEQSQHSAKRWRETDLVTSASTPSYAWSNFLFTWTNICLFVLKLVGVVFLSLSPEIVLTNIGIVLIEFHVCYRKGSKKFLTSSQSPAVGRWRGYREQRKIKVENTLSWLRN